VATAPSFKVRASSAVGAGDSFVAGMLAAMQQGLSDADALRHGMAAAAATRMTEGTALFDPADVRRLLAGEI
ncbi:MAG: PfkB family carbohydrate kinase, partial [Parvularculaceae bacterium]